MANINLELLKQLHSLGKSNRELARDLKVHHNTIAYHLKKLNLQCNTANQPIDMVSSKEARCKKCKEIKSIDKFQFGRKGQKYEYKFSFCNDCRKKQVYLNLNSNVDKFLSNCFNRLKLRSKKENIIFDLTKDQFIKQYHKQNGMCFYTNEKLICEVGRKLQRDNLSIDKIIPENGYVLANIVFTTHKINTCKNDLSLTQMSKWMPEFFFKIKIKTLKEEIESLGFKIKINTDISKQLIGAINYETKEIHIKDVNENTLNVLFSLAHEYGHLISFLNGKISNQCINARYKEKNNLTDNDKELLIIDEQLAWENAHKWLIKNQILTEIYLPYFIDIRNKALNTYKEHYGMEKYRSKI